LACLVVRIVAYDSEAKAATHCLWDDLSKEQHGRDRDENGGDRVANLVQADGQCLHARGVGQQQGHEQLVVSADDGHDVAGILLLLGVRTALDNGQRRLLGGAGRGRGALISVP